MRGAGARNSGLGLAIAKSLTGVLGGSICAESEKNKWTRMTIILPKAHLNPDSLK